MGIEGKQEKVVFVGNSRINRRLISFFQQKGWEQLTLCTRMQEGEFPSISRINWKKIQTWTAYDVVICATYHDKYILDTKREVDKKIILFDLSVPRNIDPNLSKHPLLHLYNIDQLGAMAQKKREGGGKEIVLCEKVVLDSAIKQITLFGKRREAKWRYALHF